MFLIATQQKNRRPYRQSARQRAEARSRLLSLFAVLLIVTAVLILIADKIGALSQGSQAEISEAYTGTTIATAEPDPTPFATPLGLPDLDTSEWYLQLIRYEYPLGEDYEPPSLTEIEDGEYMDSRVANALIDMIAAARASGYSVYVCSCYRSYSTQYSIYWNHVDSYMEEGMTQEEAEAATRLAVNYPGASEHQSGLAADILEYSGQDMEPYIGGSGLMLWLEENCAAFGYVIRYPDGKTDITGVEYEPWHLRYVGADAAMYMMENDLCLEEFLDLLEQYQ
ncbi:MAG: M15 family metallopeptidase [Oscillospiraceae bacterium]|nr:M15 family metallopeptidase [Oscillospiraceae bacterium]